MAGEPLKGVVTARYLFGAPMGARPVKWSFTRSPIRSAPAAVIDKFPDEQWEFVGWCERGDGANGRRGQPRRGHARQDRRAAADARRRRPTRACRTCTRSRATSKTCRGSTSPTARACSCTRRRGTSACAARRTFLQQKSGLNTEVVAVAPDGQAVAGVTVTVTLTQIQWTSVRRAEGNGFYTWDTERKEIPAGSWTVTTGAEPVPLERAAAKRRLLRPRGDRARHEQAIRRDADVVLRARRRLHRVGAVRSQPHRARARAPHLQARRHRADHDSVAVGTGHGARHDRARRRAVTSSVRADLDAAVDLDPDHRRRHPERVRLGAAREGARSGRGEDRRAHGEPARRTRRERRAQRRRGSVGSRQAGVPARIRRAERRGRVETVDGRRAGGQGRVPPGERGQGARST